MRPSAELSGVCDDCIHSALRRVNYFRGKLLGVDDLSAEQDYQRDRGRLASLATHGGGVACGLEVTQPLVTQAEGGGLVIAPGLAIDPCGREIIVPAATQMPDPRQPIDDRGTPSGPPVPADVVTLSVVYCERPDGPYTPDGASYRVLETYRIDVRPVGEASADPAVDLATVDAARSPVAITPGTRRQVATLAQLGSLVAELTARVAALETA